MEIIKTVETKINYTPEEMAELLFNMDNIEVAKIFDLWRKKFDEEVERRRDNNEPIFIYNFYHFFLYVADRLEPDGKQFFKDAFSALIYKEVDWNYQNIVKKIHKL